MPTIQYPFTTPGNYTYNTDEIEVSGGTAHLTDLFNLYMTNEGATFYNDFISLDGLFGAGVLTGTAFNGAAVAAGLLDLTGAVNKYVDYAGAANADFAQTGCIRFIYVPNYNGNPANVQFFVNISNGVNANNEVTIYKNVAGNQVVAQIYNSAGGLLCQLTGNNIDAVGVPVEVELNVDTATGAHRLLINGVTADTDATAGTRTATSTQLRVGENRTLTGNADYSMADLLIFDEVKHTADYTPDWSDIPLVPYDITNPTIRFNSTFITDELEGFVETSTKPGTDEVKYVLSKNGTDYYWSGLDWVESDGTYAQANTAAEIETNKATFVTSSTLVGIKALLHSNDGSTMPSLDELDVTYSYGGETPDTIETCIVHGYSIDPEGNPSTDTFSVQLENDVVEYKTNTILRQEKITVTPDAAGFFEVILVECENMIGTNYYLFDFGKGLEYRVSVPNSGTAKLNDLIP